MSISKTILRKLKLSEGVLKATENAEKELGKKLAKELSGNWAQREVSSFIAQLADAMVAVGEDTLVAEIRKASQEFKKGAKEED